MELDVSRLIGAVTRVVTDREHEGKPARVVIASRTYPTDIDDLWSAVTTAERLARWFSPVEGELRLGGRYQVKGNAGGTITHCEPPRAFKLTWELGGGISWVNVTLEARGDDTHLELEHIAYVEDHWKQYGPGAVGIGWELGLAGLDGHLRGETRPPESELGAWFASDNAKAFVRASGDGWRDADIASGSDPTEATERGRATVAAYGG